LCPDNVKLLTGGEDGELCIWDMVAEKKLMNLEGHTGRITSIKSFDDGK